MNSVVYWALNRAKEPSTNGYRTESANNFEKSVNNGKNQAPTIGDRGLNSLVFCEKSLEARAGIEPAYTALQAAA